MKKCTVVLIIVLALTIVGFSKTSIGAFGAMEMPNSSPIWVGATLRSIGEGIIGFEAAVMIEKNALFAGDFTSFQVLPTLYLNVPMGSSFSLYGEVTPVIYILGTSVGIKQDFFYSKNFGIEGGIALSF